MKWNCNTRAPWPWNKALLIWLLNVHYIQMRFPSAVGGASLFSSGMMCVWKRLGMKLQSGGCRVQIGDVFFAHMTSHCPHSRLQLLQTSCHLYYYSKLDETVLDDRARNGWNWNSSWKQWSTDEEKQLCCCLRFVERLQCVGLSSAHCLCACVCGVDVRGVPSPLHRPPTCQYVFSFEEHQPQAGCQTQSSYDSSSGDAATPWPASSIVIMLYVLMMKTRMKTVWKQTMVNNIITYADDN